MKLTGTAIVYVFEPKEYEVPPGHSLVRLRERIRMGASLTLTERSNTIHLCLKWYEQVYPRLNEFVEESLVARADLPMRISSHQDVTEVEWLDLKASGWDEIWLETPVHRDWQTLHVWCKCRDMEDSLRGAVRSLAIDLDDQSQTAMRHFVQELQAQEAQLELGL